MVKITLFFIIILGILIFPIFESKNYKKIQIKPINLPSLVINNGKFFKYDLNLSKKGKFTKLISNKKRYVLNDITLEDVINKEILKAKNAELLNELVKLKNVSLKTSQYYIFAVDANYFNNSGIVKGSKFKLYAKNFKGCGTSFLIDKERNVKAKNVTYFIKADK